MQKETFDYIAERCQVLAETGASKQSTKDAANAWLTAVAGADDEAVEAATAQLLDYLDGRPNPIDATIAFFRGPAIQMMGEETAAAMLASSIARKEAGAKYCGCAACTAASEILAKCGRIEL